MIRHGEYRQADDWCSLPQQRDDTFLRGRFLQLSKKVPYFCSQVFSQNHTVLLRCSRGEKKENKTHRESNVRWFVPVMPSWWRPKAMFCAQSLNPSDARVVGGTKLARAYAITPEACGNIKHNIILSLFVGLKEEQIHWRTREACRWEDVLRMSFLRYGRVE